MTVVFARPIRKVLSNLYVHVASDHITFGSLTLPARHLRYGGKEFRNDQFFVQSARAEACRLMEQCTLTRCSRVLDVGCGVGRLPLGILDYLGEIEAYRGVDVSERSIEWCKSHIEIT